MKRILLIGGGGHCRSVIDSLLTTGIYDEIGIIDRTDISYRGIHIVGNDEDLESLHSYGWTDAFVTVGSIGDTSTRRRLFHMIKKTGYNIPVVIDPSAIVSDDSVLEEGVFIGKGAIINSGCSIGECSIINSGVILEHDCKIGPFAHISSGTVLCGQTKVGENTHVGAGSVVKQLVELGCDSLIGAGSVVIQDIPGSVKAYGNPCKVVK